MSANKKTTQKSSAETYDEPYALVHYIVTYCGKHLIDDEGSLLWAAKWVYWTQDNPSFLTNSRKLQSTLDPIAMRVVSEDGALETIDRVTAVVIEREGDSLFINRCPACNRIVRTPRAKLCLCCGHNWRRE